ncbi:hypothetical protein CC80DRAFT_318414 [Byssothecium circinans]|uniref:Uncharacterized protein n=1 Tax=Byssothecium circinans TaxID=147558 RepID=A0A6A5T6V1_9PLEO|nr:hypothetical protein CC80DRAFT_318414 [Byssothecium circinans]
MQEAPFCRPHIFHTYEEAISKPGLSVRATGDLEHFPNLNNARKFERSMANARIIGLFPPNGATNNTRVKLEDISNIRYKLGRRSPPSNSRWPQLELPTTRSIAASCPTSTVVLLVTSSTLPTCDNNRYKFGPRIPPSNPRWPQFQRQQIGPVYINLIISFSRSLRTRRRL